MKRGRKTETAQTGEQEKIVVFKRKQEARGNLRARGEWDAKVQKDDAREPRNEEEKDGKGREKEDEKAKWTRRDKDARSREPTAVYLL